jgi:hypothetical protein
MNPPSKGNEFWVIINLSLLFKWGRLWSNTLSKGLDYTHCCITKYYAYFFEIS